MKAIHKYRIDLQSKKSIFHLKHGYQIVHSEYVVVEKAVFIWVQEALAVDIPKSPVGFRVVMSGEPVSENYSHVATAVDAFGPEAYHIFEEQVAHEQRTQANDNDLVIRHAGSEAA